MLAGLSNPFIWYGNAADIEECIRKLEDFSHTKYLLEIKGVLLKLMDRQHGHKGCCSHKCLQSIWVTTRNGLG
jgi:hypothetical protein